jgi:hypothetical protein
MTAEGTALHGVPVRISSSIGKLDVLCQLRLGNPKFVLRRHESDYFCKHHSDEKQSPRTPIFYQNSSRTPRVAPCISINQKPICTVHNLCNSSRFPSDQVIPNVEFIHLLRLSKSGPPSL